MKLVFLDDSVQRDVPRSGLGELIALGAVIVPEDQVLGFAGDLIALKKELGIPVGEEIKWKSPKGSFLAAAGGEVVATCRARLISAAIARGIKSVVHVVDHGRVYRERSTVEVGQELLKWTYDKLAMALGGEPAVIIADKPGGSATEESHWLAETLTVTNDGTEYTQPGTVVLPVLTAASHHVPHLQLADMITAATTAEVAGRKSGHDLAPLLHKVAHKMPVATQVVPASPCSRTSLKTCSTGSLARTSTYEQEQSGAWVQRDRSLLPQDVRTETKTASPSRALPGGTRLPLRDRVRPAGLPGSDLRSPWRCSVATEVDLPRHPRFASVGRIGRAHCTGGAPSVKQQVRLTSGQPVSIPTDRVEPPVASSMWRRVHVQNV